MAPPEYCKTPPIFSPPIDSLCPGGQHQRSQHQETEGGGHRESLRGRQKLRGGPVPASYAPADGRQLRPGIQGVPAPSAPSQPHRLGRLVMQARRRCQFPRAVAGVKASQFGAPCEELGGPTVRLWSLHAREGWQKSDEARLGGGGARCTATSKAGHAPPPAQAAPAPACALGGRQGLGGRRGVAPTMRKRVERELGVGPDLLREGGSLSPCFLRAPLGPAVLARLRAPEGVTQPAPG